MPEKKSAAWQLAAMGALPMMMMAGLLFGKESERDKYRREWWESLHPAERFARNVAAQFFGAINRASARVTHWLLEPDDETTPEHLKAKPRSYTVGVDESAA